MFSGNFTITFLFPIFNRLEESTEVTLAEATAGRLLLTVVLDAAETLNDFDEESRTIEERLGEDLEEATFFVTVDEDTVLVAFSDDFRGNHTIHLAGNVVLVVSLAGVSHEGNTTAHDGSGVHASDGLDDVRGGDSDVLNTSALVVIKEGLNLRLTASTSGGFVDGQP